MDTLMKWLRGEPVQVDGITYIFPHGGPAMRKLLAAAPTSANQ